MVKFIRKTLNECEPKIDLERVVNAPSGEQVTVRVTFGVEFLFSSEMRTVLSMKSTI